MRRMIMRKLGCLFLALTLVCGILPAAAWELPEQGSAAQDVLDNCKRTLDGGAWSTLAEDGGAGHLQGIVCDDAQKYMYMSFTNMMVKVDMESGEIVGTVKGMAAGSIASGAHIGCIAYYDGKIYGSLEYKASERWYICVFDGEAITGDMHYTDPGVMYGLYVPQVGDDFKDELAAGEHNNNANSLGHRYGTGGIDGITFGTLPGKGYDTDGDGQVDVADDKTYMIVTYGPYGNASRYDNENFVFLVYDPAEIDAENLLPFNETRLTSDITEGEKYLYKHKLFCYAGNQTYGVQQLEYDQDTGDLWLECYGRPDGTEFPKYSRFVIDGSIPLYMDEVEVGQSVTGDADGFVTQAVAKTAAACYTDYEDGDGDGDTTEQETGWHMTLKCICGKGGMENHEAAVYGEAGRACRICGGSAQFSTGLLSLGSSYFYGASSGTKTVDGKKCQWGTASLYWLDRDAWVFEKIPEPARLLVSYTMDAADTYEKDGKVYIKDVSGNGYDALVEGTYAAADQDANAGAALGFRGDRQGDVLDRVSMTDAAMAYINEQVETSFSYSFWLYNEEEMDRFTPIIGMYRDEALQQGLYAGVFEWRYRSSPGIVVHNGTGSPDYRTLADGTQYLARPGSNGGDGNVYLGGISGKMQTWNHYVVVRSGSQVTVYCNGETTNASNSSVGDNTLDNLTAFEIGGSVTKSWKDSNNRTRFTGSIDDVQLYAGELSQVEARALYEAGPAVSIAAGSGAVSDQKDKTFAPAYTGTVLPEQEEPILHYTLDETGTVKDVSGNGKHAAATEYVAAVADREGDANSALFFDGQQYTKPTKLTLSDEDTAWLSAQINGTGKLTISFWMNADMENGHRMSILGLYDKTGRPMGTFETRGLLGQDRWLDGKFAIAFTAAKPYESGVLDEKTYEQLAITNTDQYAVDGDTAGGSNHYGDKQVHTWYHVVGELDQTSNTMRLYVDGQLAQEVSIAEDTLSEVGYFMVGMPAGRYYQYENASNTTENNSSRQGWSMRGGFVGCLDELRVYNRILSEAEIAALYMENVPHYIVKSLTLQDSRGETLTQIPDGGFYVRAEVEKAELAEDAVLMVAAYTQAGQMLESVYLEADVPGGSTYALGAWMNNTEGRIGKIKAFLLSSISEPVPMGVAAEFPG